MLLIFRRNYIKRYLFLLNMKGIFYFIGTTLEGCATNDSPQDTSQLERTLEISYFEMEPDCIQEPICCRETLGEVGTEYCTLDDSVLITIQLAYSGSSEEINSALLKEYHTDEEYRYNTGLTHAIWMNSTALSRDISADPYRFQGYWTTVSTLNNHCCPAPGTATCGTPADAPASIVLTVEAMYLASQKEEFELSDVYIYRNDNDCAESE